MEGWTRLAGIAGLVACSVALLCLVAYAIWAAWLRKPDAYIYVPEGMPTALWRYQQFKMTECKYCGSKVQLNRHHIQSFASAPELKDDPNNIVCLCRKCHCSVAHGNNWKRFNSNLLETLKTPVWVDSNSRYKETHGGKGRTETRR